jgi:hypothetical protein
MTETTSIDPLIRDRRVYVPAVVARPALTTVMAQAMVGYVAANFLLIVVSMLLVHHIDNFMYLLLLPFVLVFGVIAGVVVGLFIWAGFEFAGKTINSAYRSIIGVMMMALAWLTFILLFSLPLPPPEVRLRMLGMILAPAIGMGLVTGSRLRLWRELVRRGDPVGTVVGAFAGLTGVILRLLIPVLFMASCIGLISSWQNGPQELPLIWWALMCGHFAAGGVLIFARMKTDALLPLAVLVCAPVAAAWQTFPLLRHVAIAYLTLWAMFLLTRWRQTQVAFSVLKEEFRYYLID